MTIHNCGDKISNMKSVIIDTLIYNNIHGEEFITSEKYDDLMSELHNQIDSLSKGLTEEQKIALNDIYYRYIQIDWETAETYFESGFKLGVKFGKEIFGQ